MSDFELLGFDHMGLRVSTERKDECLEFYNKLGFIPEEGEDLSQFDAVALINPESGLRINLIHDGETRDNNVLLDTQPKWPGITHICFKVSNAKAFIDRAREQGLHVASTGHHDGHAANPTDEQAEPYKVSDRRIVSYLRDPDGNLIEFDENLWESDRAR